VDDNKAFFKIENLTVEYTSGGEKIHAVNGVSLELEKGKTLALVGETGAGKTTIAKSILRILPDRAARIVSGSVLLNGQDLLRASEAEMRKIRGNVISMIFQDPMTALNPVIRVGEQIAEVILKHNANPEIPAMDQAVKMLEMVGIPGDRAIEYPHQFSGGMKQRVVIAMALACNPDLILADEPTTALDVTIQAQILEMIADLKKKHNTSMILITHDLAVVGSICDTVAIVYAGEILEYGDMKEIFLHPAHPYTVGLFGAIPDLKSRTRRLANIEGLPPDPSNLPQGCCFSPRCTKASAECFSKKFEMRKLGPEPSAEQKGEASGVHYCSCVHAAGTEETH